MFFEQLQVCPFSVALMLNSDDFTLGAGAGCDETPHIFSIAQSCCPEEVLSEENWEAESYSLEEGELEDTGDYGVLFSVPVGSACSLACRSEQQSRSELRKKVPGLNLTMEKRSVIQVGLRSLSVAPFRPYVLINSGWW
jgi:hypothetical protein